MKFAKYILQRNLIKCHIKWGRSLCACCDNYKHFNYEFETKHQIIVIDGGRDLDERWKYHTICKKCYLKILKEEEIG